MTVQVEGIGTMAGPPARGRISAGRALASVNIAAVESMLVVVVNSILEFGERVGRSGRYKRRILTLSVGDALLRAELCVCWTVPGHVLEIICVVCECQRSCCADPGRQRSDDRQPSAATQPLAGCTRSNNSFAPSNTIFADLLYDSLTAIVSYTFVFCYTRTRCNGTAG